MVVEEDEAEAAVADAEVSVAVEAVEEDLEVAAAAEVSVAAAEDEEAAVDPAASNESSTERFKTKKTEASSAGLFRQHSLFRTITILTALFFS